MPKTTLRFPNPANRNVFSCAKTNYFEKHVVVGLASLDSELYATFPGTVSTSLPFFILLLVRLIADVCFACTDGMFGCIGLCQLSFEVVESRYRKLVSGSTIDFTRAEYHNMNHAGTKSRLHLASKAEEWLEEPLLLAAHQGY